MCVCVGWGGGDTGDNSLFMKAFHDKGRVSPFLAKIPLYAVLVEDLGERGAQWMAVKVRRWWICDHG